MGGGSVSGVTLSSSYFQSDWIDYDHKFSSILYNHIGSMMKENNLPTWFHVGLSVWNKEFYEVWNIPFAKLDQFEHLKVWNNKFYYVTTNTHHQYILGAIYHSSQAMKREFPFVSCSSFTNFFFLLVLGWKRFFPIFSKPKNLYFQRLEKK